MPVDSSPITHRSSPTRRRALGQYFTPPAVAAFALRAVRELAGTALPPNPWIIDPACGDGVFLRAALRQEWSARATLVGLDVDPAVSPAWREDGLERRAILRVADGLLDRPGDGIVPGAFDVVVGNPPYGRTPARVFDPERGLRPLEGPPPRSGGDGMRAPGDVEARRRAVLSRYECWRLGTPFTRDQVPVTSDPSLATTGDWSPVTGHSTSGVESRMERLALRRLERFPVELLFVERFLQLARPGGWLAVVLPDGLLGNPRLQPFRDWLLERMTPLAVVGLPRGAFGGAASHTALLIGQKRRPQGAAAGREGRVQLLAPPHRPGATLTTYLEEVARYLSPASPEPASSESAARGAATSGRRRGAAVCAPSSGRPSAGPHPPKVGRVPTFGGWGPTSDGWGLTPRAGVAGTVVATRDRTLHAATAVARLRGKPWSPQYWDPEVEEVAARLTRTPFPLEPLGRRDEAGNEIGFLRYTTYGAVGARHFRPAGVRYLTPRNLVPTGVDLLRCERFVAPGGRNDPLRSRLRYGDILLSNSGVASLGRPALFHERGDCNISQHVNLIRVAGIDACYVALYLHTCFARAQMRRLHSGTGAAGLSYDDIRSLLIPVLPTRDQAAIREAFLRMHAAHAEAMACKAAAEVLERSEDCPRYQRAIQRAGGLLATLVATLEAYILRPGDAGFEACGTHFRS